MIHFTWVRKVFVLAILPVFIFGLSVSLSSDRPVNDSLYGLNGPYLNGTSPDITERQGGDGGGGGGSNNGPYLTGTAFETAGGPGRTGNDGSTANGPQLNGTNL